MHAGGKATFFLCRGESAPGQCFRKKEGRNEWRPSLLKKSLETRTKGKANTAAAIPEQRALAREYQIKYGHRLWLRGRKK